MYTLPDLKSQVGKKNSSRRREKKATENLSQQTLPWSQRLPTYCQVYDEEKQKSLRHHHQGWYQSMVQQRVVVVPLDWLASFPEHLHWCVSALLHPSSCHILKIFKIFPSPAFFCCHSCCCSPCSTLLYKVLSSSHFVRLPILRCNRWAIGLLGSL